VPPASAKDANANGNDPTTHNAVDGDEDDLDSVDPQRARLHHPDLNAKTDEAYAALCKRAALDLQGWRHSSSQSHSHSNSAAAAAAADAHMQQILEGAYAAAVKDAATGALCSGQAMLQRVAASRSQTAKARFQHHVVLMQLAAWVDARMQQADVCALTVRDRRRVV
jgi:hypothetical protein